MKEVKVTRVIYSIINNKWYLQLNRVHEIEIPERDARKLIEDYDMAETNFDRWEII